MRCLLAYTMISVSLSGCGHAAMPLPPAIPNTLVRATDALFHVKPSPQPSAKRKFLPNQIVTGRIEGDIAVVDPMLFEGVATGTVTVERGAYLETYGTIERDLIVHHGAIVQMHGYVRGNLYNQGGDVTIDGTVTGSTHRQGGTTVIDPHAKLVGPVLDD